MKQSQDRSELSPGALCGIGVGLAFGSVFLLLFIGGPYIMMLYGAIGFLGFLGTFLVLAIVRGQALTVQHVCDYLREIESMRVEGKVAIADLATRFGVPEHVVIRKLREWNLVGYIVRGNFVPPGLAVFAFASVRPPLTSFKNISVVVNLGEKPEDDIRPPLRPGWLYGAGFALLGLFYTTFTSYFIEILPIACIPISMAIVMNVILVPYDVRRHLLELMSTCDAGKVFVSDLVKKYGKSERYITKILQYWDQKGFFVDGKFNAAPVSGEGQSEGTEFSFTSVRFPRNSRDAIFGIKPH